MESIEQLKNTFAEYYDGLIKSTPSYQTPTGPVPVIDGRICAKDPLQCFRRTSDRYAEVLPDRAILVTKTTTDCSGSGIAQGYKCLTTLVLPPRTRVHIGSKYRLQSNGSQVDLADHDIDHAKCRADRAFVVGNLCESFARISANSQIPDYYPYGLPVPINKTCSDFYINFEYMVDKFIQSKFDTSTDGPTTCAEGIHFFLKPKKTFDWLDDSQ